MTKKFSIKKLVAGVLAAAMVVTALPVSGLNAKAADAETLRVYRSYNPNSGEHLYTTNAAEQAMVVAQGRTDEGVKFLVPATSSTPVYRAYNPNSGEHLLVPKGEAEGLAAIGWSNEGIKMYSDDNKGVPIYRVYNPDPNAGAGAHLYTSKEEATALVAIGWKWDNNGEAMIYGINEEVTNELALEKVEGADAGINQVLMAYFNKPVGDLQPGDIQIRRVSDDELVTVEKVVMSSDKKTATLSLVGASVAGYSASIENNTDYNMTVTSNGEKASKVFSIPAVADNRTVQAVDPTKKTITLAQSLGDGRTTADASDLTLNVPDSVTVDYTEILGRTVTAKYDKNRIISTIKMAGETVVYGAFKVTDKYGDDGAGKTGYYKEAVSGDLYPVVADAQEGTTSIYQTLNINNGYTKSYDLNGAGGAGDKYAWARLVLNGDGTVRSLTNIGNFTDCALVDKVVGDVAYCDKEEINFKDYVFIKDGKTAKVDDTLNNTVFYNVTEKVAVIYTATLTGKLSAVYDKSFKVGDKSFDYKTAAGVTTAKYIDGKLKDLTADKLNSYKSSGKDVTVYTGIDGSAVIVTGNDGAAATEDTILVLTRQPKVETKGFDTFLSVEGYNAKTSEIERYSLDAADFTSLGLQGTTITFDAGKASLTAGNATLTATGKKSNGDAATITIANDGLGSGNPATLADGKYAAGSVVTLTREVESKKYVGLSVAHSFDLAKVGADAPDNSDHKFKKGYTTINQFPVAADAVVFTLEADGTDKTGAPDGNLVGAVTNEAIFTGASHAAYALYADEVAVGDRTVADATASTADIQVFLNSDKKVSAVVLFKVADKKTTSPEGANKCNDKAWGGAGEEGTAYYAVVKSFSEGTGSGKNATPDSLTVVGNAGEKTYNAFKSDYIASKTDLKKGAFVKVTPYKDDANKVFTLELVAPVDGDTSVPANDDPTGAVLVDPSGVNFAWSSTGFDPNNAVDDDDWTLSDSYTVVKITAGDVEKVTWSDANQKDTKIWIHKQDDTSAATRFFDFAVISTDDSAGAITVAELEAIAGAKAALAGGANDDKDGASATGGITFTGGTAASFVLPTTVNGCTVSWGIASSGATLASSTLTANVGTDSGVTLTATITKGGSNSTKTFTVTCGTANKITAIAAD